MAQDTVKALALTSIASSTLTTSYKPINASGFEAAPFLIRIMNASTQAVTVSLDGVNDHDFVLSNSTDTIPSQANSQPKAQVALFAKGTVIYVKGTAGTGTIYLSGFYV